jgi:lipopolysaccharide export system protein LptA
VWQKRLRVAIALFVVVFATAVGVSLRRGHKQAAPAALPPKTDPNAIVQSGPGIFNREEKGKSAFSIKFGSQATYPDNRSKFGGGVTVVLPDKNGRQITIASDAAEVTTPPGKQIGTAAFTGGVKLTTSDGITVTGSTATYADDDQTARIPGPVAFSKGRMSGRGIGATYDQSRRLLNIQEQAKVDVAPDEKGDGAIHVTAKAAGMARTDHYMKFTGEVRLDGEGHVTEADEATAFLTPDDERVQRMELRGHSRITAKPGGAGPQSMSARDIDMTYAADGRTLQTAHLVEDAVVQLPGETGKGAKRISGKGIDVALAPDGATVTNLTANDHVQVDLPPDGETPARQIRSTSLVATGPPTGGIQSAAFGGGVEFRESRAARGKLAAIDRTARAERMDVRTKPGFGDLEQAAFHNKVHFTDGPQTAADSPTAIYAIAQDRMDLSPETGDTGLGPHVTDGRITVEARNIHMTLTSQKMKADTAVRSVMVQKSTSDGNAVRMPSMLKEDRPVNVRSNRLDYDGDKSVAIYEGNARLWQDNDTEIKADRIVLEDKTGNLHATTNVETTMTLSEADDKTAAAKPPEPTHTTAEELVYEDAKHRAIYTVKAHMKGPTGDVVADRIELFLAEQGGQLERAEADGNVVSKQENRRAYGRHLTYVAKDDIYTMVGLPAKVYDDLPPTCKYTEAATVTFHKAGNSTAAIGTDTAPQRSQKIECGTVVGGSH